MAMLEIGEIIHAGITVRGPDASSPESAKRKAAEALDSWQASKTPELPQGAKFSLLQEKVKQNGPEAAVTRYLQVVEG